MDDKVSEEVSSVIESFPFLVRHEGSTDGPFLLNGEIEVPDSQGNVRGIYEVKILVPAQYPKMHPVLFETGGKIIRHEDWHVNGDGTCCLAPRPMVSRLFSNGGSLVDWVNQFVLPFLANHIYKLEYGEYANEGYEHGSKGIVHAYMDLWSLESKEQVRLRLRQLLGLKKQSRNVPCICGSGKKSKRCHNGEALSNYQGVDSSVLRDDLQDIDRNWNLI